MSGGLSWPGFLATELNTTLTLTYNFAVVYATVDNAIIPAMVGGVPSISDQVDTWTKNLAPKPSYAPWTSENSLFAVYVGTNDVGNTYNKEDYKAQLNKSLDRLFVLLGSLYSSGARSFALLSVPRMSSLPKECQ